MRICFCLLLRAEGVFPRRGLFVSPLLDNPVARVSQKLGSLQSQIVSNLPAHRLALAVQPCLHLALFGRLQYRPISIFGVALLATMPEATVKLKDGLRLGVIPIHLSVQNSTLAPMTAPGMMDVNAPLLRLPLEPFGCNEAATSLRVEGFLVS